MSRTCTRATLCFLAVIALAATAPAQRPDYLWTKSFAPPANLMALSGDGLVLATNDLTYTVTLRSVDTGAVRSIISVAPAVRRIRLSGDGRLLALSSWVPNLGPYCYLIDTVTRTVLSTYQGGLYADISRDGRFLAVGDRFNVLRVYDVQLGQQLYQTNVGVYGSNDNLFPTFSPDGASVLVGFSLSGGTGGGTAFYRVGNTTALWNVAYYSRYASFSPDGSMVAFDSNYNWQDYPRLRVYSTANGSLLFQGPEQGSNFLQAFSPDGQWLYLFPRATVGSLRKYHFPGFSSTRESTIPGGSAVELSADGSKFYSANLPGVSVGTLPSGVVTGALGDFSGPAGDIAYSPDGQTLAVGGGNLRLLSAITGALVAAPVAPSGSLVFSRTGTYLVSHSFGVTAFRRDRTGLTQVGSWNKPYPGSTSFDISDDAHLAAVGYASSIESGFPFSGYSVHDLLTGQSFATTATTSPISFVALLPAANQIVLGMGSNVVIRNYVTGGVVSQYNGVGNIRALSPDRTLGAVTTGSGNIRLLRLSDGAYVGPTLFHFGSLRSITFSNDGQRVLTTNYPGADLQPSIRLWSMAGQLLGEYDDDIGGVLRGIISPLGHQMAWVNSEAILATAQLP